MKKLNINKPLIITIVIFAVFILSIVLFVESKQKKPRNNTFVNDGTVFEDLDIPSVYQMRWLGCDLSVDLTTGVLYYNNLACERMTVLVNEDGTPKNIKDYIDKDKWEAYQKEALSK